MNEKAIETARRDAHDLVVFCDGFEEGGFPELARHSRLVARELLAALDALEAERSVRVALQERCETQQQILARRAYEALP